MVRGAEVEVVVVVVFSWTAVRGEVEAVVEARRGAKREKFCLARPTSRSSWSIYWQVYASSKRLVVLRSAASAVWSSIETL